MIVIKKINNNAAICLDSLGIEVVAIGTGIGFPQVPYEIDNLGVIQRTYYDVDPTYINLLNLISEDVFQVTAKIVDIFKGQVDSEVSSNIVFTLADHIEFAIERTKKNTQIDTPLLYEIQNLYEMEYEIGLMALKLIYKDLKIRLPKSEAGNIALHLINAQSTTSKKDSSLNINEMLEEVTNIIGFSFQIYINRDSLNYSRFASHFQYLIKRQQKGKAIASDNLKMYETLIKEYPETAKCTEKIKEYLNEEFNFMLDDEELLYLILHINRLCVREDCYRKGITPSQ